ncbi:MAG: molybdopterin molybdenumtransferase MoeA, partial [Chloroflexi bacterium]|nr:molybdopterin molybdenumtransferase MoeA [Chloroflexota bacterium]
MEEALQQLLAHVQALPEETKHPLQALGQVLAEDVAADFDIPPLDNTAMDGYAVRAEDTAGAAEASPRELRVIGEVAAGYVFEGALAPGTAVRIMTGAPIPEGADAVVPFEETDEPFSRPPEGARSLSGTVHVLKEAVTG